MRLFKKNETLSIKDQLIHFLNSIDYHFSIVEDTDKLTVIQTNVSLSVGTAEGYIAIHHNMCLVEFFAHSPVNIPENKRREVAKFLNIADSNSWIGNFQLNHARGDIRSKTYMRYASEMLHYDIIKDNFFEAFNLLDRYMPGIMSVVYAGKDAETAINELYGTVNPSHN